MTSLGLLAARAARTAALSGSCTRWSDVLVQSHAAPQVEQDSRVEPVGLASTSITAASYGHRVNSTPENLRHRRLATEAREAGFSRRPDPDPVGEGEALVNLIG